MLIISDVYNAYDVCNACDAYKTLVFILLVYNDFDICNAL